MPPSTPIELTVPPEAAGQRLDAWVASQIPAMTRSRLRRLIDDGAVSLAGLPVKAGRSLSPADVVRVLIPPPEDPEPQPEPIPLDILYEDSSLLVVNKPPGLVVHPSPGHAEGTMVNALLHHCADLSGIGGQRRPGIVHRLDRDTSGLLLVAKNDEAHVALSEALARREIHRDYLAIVAGTPSRAEGRIEAPIGRSVRDRQKMAIEPARGRDAATRWKVALWGMGLTVLRLGLETGRTHQIRVHLASLHWPVVGDRTYGLARKREIELVPHGESALIQALSRVERQMLHAERIEFRHPADARPMAFEAPPPADMQALLDAIRPRPTQAELERRMESPGDL